MAVLTCTHNQCFEQTLEKYIIFLYENEHFYSHEILLFIAWACLRSAFPLKGRLCHLIVAYHGSSKTLIVGTH